MLRGACGQGLGLGFGRQHVLQTPAQGVVQAALDQRHGGRRCANKAAGHGLGPGQQLLGCVQLHHDPQAQGFLGIDIAGRQHDLFGALRADHARQGVERAHVRHQAHFEKRHIEPGARRGQHKVSRQSQAKARARRRAIDRGDHRAVQREQNLHPLVQGLHAGQPTAVVQICRGDVFQVTARAEMPARAGDHQGADAAVLLDLDQGQGQLIAHGRLHRVALGGAVEGDGGDLLAHLHLQQRRMCHANAPA